MVKFALLPISTVPKFPIAKNSYFTALENEVRFSENSLHIFSVSKSDFPHCFPQGRFNRGTRAFIGSHVAFSLFGSKFVHKSDKYRKTL